MYSDLYEKGFIFFDEIDIPEEVKFYLSDINNYTIKEDEDHVFEMKEFPDFILNLLLPSISKISTKVTGLGAKMFLQGYSLYPHRDTITESNYNVSSSIFLLWFCPDNFEGREFVWGEIKDLDKIELLETKQFCTEIGWDDPNLITLGEFKPSTGAGVVFDRINPRWWHGVKELISSSRVITIGGYI